METQIEKKDAWDTTVKAPMTLRCKAFGGEGVRANLVSVDYSRSTPAVRVWDGVAYTTAHSLSPAAERRIVRAWEAECDALAVGDLG